MERTLFKLLPLTLLFFCFASYGQSAKWTVMVYMNADNNLEGDGINDFLEMARVDNSPDVNVLVQMDRGPEWATEYGNWQQTLRFKVQKGMKPTLQEKKQDLGEVDMGDPNVLKDFIDWSKKNYPADYYILVIWGHGDGWKYMESAMVNEQLRELYIMDYKKDLAAVEKLKSINESKTLQGLTYTMSSLEKKQDKLVGYLNYTAKQMTVLPVPLKRKLNVTADFFKLDSSFKIFINSAIEKIPRNQYKLVDKYGGTMDSLLMLKTSINNIKERISTIQYNLTTSTPDSDNNLKIGRIKADPVKAVSNDDTNNDVLYNKEIHNILPDSVASIIGFDACLMSMLEIGYTLKNKSAFVVGSEELEPGTGWNYKYWLGDLVENPKMKPAELARDIVKNYGKAYEDQSQVTLSSLDMSLVQKLCDKIDDLSKLLIDNIGEEYAYIKESRENCIKYATSYLK